LRKYERPEFLPAIVKQACYEKWLRGRAIAHVKRDKKRGNVKATVEMYKTAIQSAVNLSEGRDHYTAESLDWLLVGTYSNAESKANGRTYKANLALLPSVDHVGDARGVADFKICAWRTNDAKHDLTHDDFVALCRRVVEHFDHSALAGTH
jgi:hypothetical protein